LFCLDLERPVRIFKNPDGAGNFAEHGRPGGVVTRQDWAAGLPDNIGGKMPRQLTFNQQVQRWESRSAKKKESGLPGF
jgi:hypothetical protein